MEAFLASGHFAPDDPERSPALQLLARFAPVLPELQRLPGAERVYVVALCKLCLLKAILFFLKPLLKGLLGLDQRKTAF